MAKFSGDNFGNRRKGARASLAGSDFVVDALEKTLFGILMVLERILREWLKEDWEMQLKRKPRAF